MVERCLEKAGVGSSILSPGTIFIQEETPIRADTYNKVHWILRVSAAFCFIGHGAFGVITKVEWLRYFFLGKIPPTSAYDLMPIIGIIDILMGITMLAYPCAGVLIWMSFWALFTALLRPLAGQGGWEAMERAGNYGVPVALLVWSGWSENALRLFQKIKIAPVPAHTAELVKTILTVTTALLLVGHGGCMAVLKKDLFVYQLMEIGIQASKSQLMWVGLAEIVMGVAVFLWRSPKLLLFIVAWKVVTELGFPLSGAPVWEFIERFGSYGAPLALYFLLKDEGGVHERR